MAEQQAYLTHDGYSKIEAELENLRVVRRREVAERIQLAKELGGTVDNADYDSAKNEQAFVEGRILELERLLKSAVIIPQGADTSCVQVGSKVTVQVNGGKKEVYVIVGSAEADPAQGRISNLSPVGKALLGKCVGDEAQVAAPAGARRLKIVSIS